MGIFTTDERKHIHIRHDIPAALNEEPYPQHDPLSMGDNESQ